MGANKEGGDGGFKKKREGEGLIFNSKQGHRVEGRGGLQKVSEEEIYKKTVTGAMKGSSFFLKKIISLDPGQLETRTKRQRYHDPSSKDA